VLQIPYEIREGIMNEEKNKEPNREKILEQLNWRYAVKNLIQRSEFPIKIGIFWNNL